MRLALKIDTSFIIGYATVTRFEVTCRNWKDESFRQRRDPVLDDGVPVVYKIEQFTRLGSYLIYDGGECTCDRFNVGN